MQPVLIGLSGHLDGTRAGRVDFPRWPAGGFKRNFGLWATLQDIAKSEGASDGIKGMTNPADMIMGGRTAIDRLKKRFGPGMESQRVSENACRREQTQPTPGAQ